MTSIVCLMQLALFGLAAAVEAQPAHKIKRAQPATTSRASPEMTGTLANTTPKAPGGRTPSAMLASVPDPTAPDEAALPPLFNLPSASRARMRACGERWRQVKLEGTAGDEIWRDFAAECLAAKTDPLPAATISLDRTRPVPTVAGQSGSGETKTR